MTEQEAAQTLAGAKVVEAIVADIQEVKRLRQQCLDKGIPAAMSRSCGKGGG